MPTYLRTYHTRPKQNRSVSNRTSLLYAYGFPAIDLAIWDLCVRFFAAKPICSCPPDKTIEAGGCVCRPIGAAD